VVKDIVERQSKLNQVKILAWMIQSIFVDHQEKMHRKEDG